MTAKINERNQCTSPNPETKNGLGSIHLNQVETIGDVLPIGIIVIDHSIITYINPHTCKLLGYGQAYCLNQEITGLIEGLESIDFENSPKPKLITNAYLLCKSKQRVLVQLEVSAPSFLKQGQFLISLQKTTPDTLENQKLTTELNNLKKGEDDHTRELEKALARLRKSEQRLAEAQFISRIGNWEWDMQNKNTYWSNELFNILDVNGNEITPGKEAFLQRIHPEDRGLLEEKIDTLISQRAPFSFDHRIILPNGNVRYVNSMARIDYNTGDEPLRIFGITQDISERKNTEAELRVKSSAIAESINGIGMTDIEGNIVYVNKAFLEMWGYQKERQVLGRSISDFWADDMVKKSIANANEKRGSFGEQTAIRKDGSTFAVQFSTTYIKDELGNPFYMFGSFIDISTRKKIEEKLIQSAHWLSEVQRIAKMGIWELGFQKQTFIWSEEAARLFGVNHKHPATLKTLIDNLHADDRQNFLKLIEKASGGKIDKFRHFYRIVKNTGTELFIYEEGDVIKDKNGNALKIIGICQDYTQMRKAEEETERLKTELTRLNRIGSLAAMSTAIAHEINQPLAAILSNAQAALRFLKSESPDLNEIEAALKDIVSDDKRAGDAIKNIRALIRKEEPVQDRFNINDVIEGVITLLSKQIAYAKVKINPLLNYNIPNIIGNNAQMKQVLQNLLNNAIEALEDIDYKKRLIKIVSGIDNLGRVFIEIRDSGPGISEINTDTLFESFYTTKKDGMGIGLSLCKSIIEAHNGTISARNHKDGGAIFKFTLPCEQK